MTQEKAVIQNHNEMPAARHISGNGLTNDLVHAIHAIAEGFIDRNGKTVCHQCLHSREVLEEITSSLRSVLLPGYFGCSEVRKVRKACV